MNKMDPDVKEKWITALTSGEFKQGNGKLLNDGKYCCLGVLCEIFRREHPDSSHWIFSTYSSSTMFAVSRDVSSGRCPTGVVNWSGMDDDRQEALIDFNDSRHKSFKWIAAYIKRYL